MQNWQLVACSKIVTIHDASSQSSSPVFSFSNHRGIVNCASFNQQNKVITTCGQDSKIFILKASNPKNSPLLEMAFNQEKQQPASVNFCSFSPQSSYVAAGSVNKLVQIWNIKRNKQLMTKIIHTGSVSSLDWFSTEDVIASSSITGDVLLHSVKTGTLIQSFKAKDCINDIKISSDKKIAACTTSGSVLVWDVNSTTGKPICNFTDSKSISASTSCLSLNPLNPSVLAASSISGTFSFYDINNNKLIQTIGTQYALTSIAFNGNENAIAVGADNGSILVYDRRKLSSPRIKLKGHETQIKHLQFASAKGISSKREKQREKEKDKQVQRQRVLNQNSSHGNIPETESRVVRNLARRQQNPSQTHLKSQNVQPARNNISNTYIQSNNNHVTTNNNNNSNNNSSNSELMSRVNGLQNTVSSFRSQIHEQFSSLHLEIIKQLQIQQKQQKKMYEEFNRERQEMKHEIQRLKTENNDLKKRTY